MYISYSSRYSYVAIFVRTFLHGSLLAKCGQVASYIAMHYTNLIPTLAGHSIAYDHASQSRKYI